jgi:RNA recognition motif-containing protein
MGDVMGKRLLIGNLSSSATVAELLALFGQFGLVESANIKNGMGSIQINERK